MRRTCRILTRSWARACLQRQQSRESELTLLIDELSAVTRQIVFAGPKRLPSARAQERDSLVLCSAGRRRRQRRLADYDESIFYACAPALRSPMGNVMGARWVESFGSRESERERGNYFYSGGYVRYDECMIRGLELAVGVDDFTWFNNDWHNYDLFTIIRSDKILRQS